MVREIKVRKRRKRKWNRTIAILSFVIVMGTIITFSALRQINPLLPPPVPKEPASEYFAFSDVFAIAESQDSENRTIFVSEVGFMIKAVGGNATDITIVPLTGFVRDYPYFDIISRGANESVDIIYPYKVGSTKTADGYPLSFRIHSVEATGEVTINITEFFPPMT